MMRRLCRMTLTQICKPRTDKERELAHLIGDAKHRIAVYTALGEYGSQVDNKFLSNAAQARWIKAYRPDLVVRDPSGNYPSDHSLGTIFEIEFNCTRSFKSQYLGWLYGQDVGRHLASSADAKWNGGENS
jgi:hypothetical protein